jgi:UDPglucose 6-dehydrogenase
MNKQNLCIIGSGYVGLVTGACLAEVGHKVTCIDNDKEKIKNLKKGIIPIYEPGLSKLVKKNHQAKNLNFSTQLKKAVEDASAIFIAVGTPSSRRGDGYADLTYVFEVAKNISKYLNQKDFKLVINKSTVPVGTADQVQRVIQENNPKANFEVASNPEFLREGSAVPDFLEPDRVVVGVNNKKSEQILKKIYADFLAEVKAKYAKLNKSKGNFQITDVRSAELIKYASNSFLAVKISFINEISNLCEKLGANIKAVSKGMGLDERIGDKFLNPGPGYGGSCFPKDVSALLRIAQENETPLRILEATMEVNIAQKARMIRKIKEILGKNESKKKVLFLGLTFKPNTDDMRDAPAITIIPALLEKGIEVFAHDPEGIKEAKKILPKTMNYLSNEDQIYEKAKQVDLIVLLTEWEDYLNLDFKKLRKSYKGDYILDLRNLYEPEKIRKFGFKYRGLGR